jgi:spore photoproduct lyase
VIHAPGWEEAYAKVVTDIFSAVPAESIAWISVGTLRMTPAQKKTIENRFPENTILDAELLMAEDGKLRYAHKVRLDIYRKMMGWIRERAHFSTQVYFCMETASIWKEAGVKLDWNF